MKPSARATGLPSLVGSSEVRGAASAAMPVGLWSRLVARLRSWFEIPYGYEDEQGFHYGIEPRPSRCSVKSCTAQKVHTDRASDVMPSPCPVTLDDTHTSPDDHRHPA